MSSVQTKYILQIDTSQAEGSRIVLTAPGKSYEREIQGPMSAQKVLSELDVLLRSASANIKQLSGISIVTGPGSYTGLRVGTAVARALGVLLQIPVNRRDPMEPLPLEYEHTAT